MQVVAVRNIAVGQRSFGIGDELIGVSEARVVALLRDGFAMVVEPKSEFEAKVSELSEVENLDPEKNGRRTKK